jgi:5-methylthioadenosine/S-adenosylhomocysteine deaminase
MIIGPCCVVTGGAEPHVIEDGAVRVVGAHIAQVASAGSLAAAHADEPRWPGRGRVLMPGLVNAHTHLARRLARGLGLRGPAAWERYDRALAPEDVRWGALAALAEGLRHGVTTVCDFHRSAGCLDLSLSEILDAARAIGVRVVTCYGAAEHDAPAERRAALEESLAFARQIASRRSGRAAALLGVRAATLGGLERLMDEALEAAGEQHAVHVDLDLDATPAERWSVPARWPASASRGLWAHAERAPRALLGAVRERGDVLAAIAGSSGALAREPEIGWGSDAGANAPPAAGAGPGAGDLETALTPVQYRRLFVVGPRWAAPHFGTGLGVIAPGAPADLVLRDYRPCTELSALTLPAHLAAGLLRAPVSGAMVAGEIVMDNGVLVTTDEDELASRARASARRVWEALEG